MIAAAESRESGERKKPKIESISQVGGAVAAVVTVAVLSSSVATLGGNANKRLRPHLLPTTKKFGHSRAAKESRHATRCKSFRCIRRSASSGSGGAGGS